MRKPIVLGLIAVAVAMIAIVGLVYASQVSVCAIKGNFSSSGIYHAPGQSYYDTAQRWFCTVQEAIRSGWRKLKI